MADDPAVRAPRADAQRNRLRLLDAAKTAFADTGPDASLEAIARVAGVGIGTLYRHFPTRDALIAAVYRNEAEQLFAAAEQLAQAEPPLTALRQWLLVFVDHLVIKRGLSAALESLVDGPADLYAASGTGVKQAIRPLVDRAVASGDIRMAIDPVDLLRAIAAIAKSEATGSHQSARALVDILIAGLRTGTNHAFGQTSTTLKN